MNKYYIVYFFTVNGTQGMGNSVVTNDGKMNWETIKAITDDIKKSEKYDSMIILNWKKLDE